MSQISEGLVIDYSLYLTWKTINPTHKTIWYFQMKTKENIVVKSDSVVATLDGTALEGLSEPMT